MTKWRAASLVGVHVAAAAHLLHWQLAGRTLAPVEPSEMFDTLHLGVVTVGFVFTVGVVLATALVGRFFCGWGCHILALQDLSAWLLGKVGVPTRPIRSRTLVWVPALAALYLFAGPQVERLLRGEPLPTLHVVTDRDEWTSFTTDDLLRSFPGPGMTVMTFVVCGFAAVYFLGSRSFCSYACPYGALFAAAERASPLRVIAGPGACSDCGICTSGCKSNVRVIEEVRRHGAVIDAGCMKDLDCVSACPTGALALGITTPPLLRGSSTPRTKKPYDFTPAEDALLAAAFVAALVVARGLYDAVSFLLALAVAVLVAYAAVIGLRLISATNLEFGTTSFKRAGVLTVAGRFAAAALLALATLVVHSGVVRYHEFRGDSAAWRLASLEARGSTDAEAVGSLRSEAIAQLEQASWIGLVTPAGWRVQLAQLYLRAGSPADARRHLNARLAADSDDHASRVLLAQAWVQEGREALGQQQAEQVISTFAGPGHQASQTASARRIQSSAHYLLGDLAGRRGDHVEATKRFEEATRLYSKHADAHFALGLLLLDEGRTIEAESALTTAIRLRPHLAGAQQALDELRDAEAHDE
ncbi:MAG: 4Fe-4S binding protein [Lacipirellulaceae bacterium]